MMEVSIQNISGKTGKRYDIAMLKIMGMFEDDIPFSFRLMSYEVLDLSKQDILKHFKSMLANQSEWKEGKQFFVYNYSNSLRGFISKKAWNEISEGAN